MIKKFVICIPHVAFQLLSATGSALAGREISFYCMSFLNTFLVRAARLTLIVSLMKLPNIIGQKIKKKILKYF
jgi:hypothetical protein